MTSAQIVGLGVRLFAIWLVVSVLRHVPGMWRFNVSGAAAGDSATNVVIVAVTVIMLALAAGLWFFPLAVANKLIPRSSNMTISMYLYTKRRTLASHCSDCGF